MTLDALEIVVMAFAAYRITRFFVLDSFMGFGPDSGSGASVVVDHFAYHEDGSNRSWVRGKIGDLLTCTWCLGFWVSLAVVCAWTQTNPWDLGNVGVLTVFGVAGAQGYLSSRMNA